MRRLTKEVSVMKGSTMRRVILKALGGPEQLVEEVIAETPRPGPGEVLVEVEAAGVNYVDVLQRQGVTYPPPLPCTPGLEGVGRIRTLGEAVDGSGAFSVGRRVAWMNVRGSYASRLVVPVEQAIPVPDSFPVTDALLFQSITAQYLVTEYRDVRPGDQVLVHAAAGGVGMVLVQWLKHLGARVLGTASSEEKLAAIRAAGADAAINYGHDYAFLDELMALTDGRGVDLALDSVGAGTFANSVKALARGGTAVCFGASSGKPPAIEPMSLIDPCARVAGGSVFSFIKRSGELERRGKAVVDGIQAGWLRLGEGKAYDLGRAAEAHRDIEGRGTRGKLYLTP